MIQDEILPDISKLVKEVDKHFPQASCKWEERRKERLFIEDIFTNFSGHIDCMELHIPFTKYQYVFDRMQQTNKLKGKKILALIGDNINLDMFSFFYKTSTDFELPSYELAQFIKLLKVAHKIYDWIVVMITNHDNRIYKIIRKMMMGKDQAQEMLKWMKSYETIFESEGLNKVLTVNSAIFQIGDVLLTHFENNSVVPGNVPRDLIKYLVPRIEKPFNFIIQAHTHFQQKIPIDRISIIESGACCKVMDYWRRGRMRGKGKMSSLGYAICKMRNGQALPNETNFVFCEWEDWL